jgi:hypothetical protein
MGAILTELRINRGPAFFHAAFVVFIIFLSRPGSILPAFFVNFDVKPSLDGRARCAPRKKTAVPGGRTPPFCFLASRSGPLPAGHFTRLAMMPGRTEKENKMTNTNKNEAAATKNPPVAKIRVDLINASIWKNPTDKGTFYNVTFESRYRDGEGNWKSSHSYTSNDLLALAKAADLAHTKIVELRNAENE